MNEGPRQNYVEVARDGTAVLFRVHGLGNMHLSPVIAAFAEACLADGSRHFAIDLADCDGMDSTFMGNLVGMMGPIEEKGGWLCLLNISEENRDLLKMIGVWKLVRVVDSFPVDAIETECLHPDTDPAARIEHIRLAHQHLVEIDERNRERFGRFLAALEAEMDLPRKESTESIQRPDESGADDSEPGAEPETPPEPTITPPSS